MPERDMRVIGLAGWSGAGKTTLLTKLIPALTRRGLRVATLKHARTAGGDLHLCALQDDVRAIFDMTRLSKAVTIHGTRGEALTAWV